MEDIRSGDLWYFFVNWWFVLEKGFGEIEYEINVVNKYEFRKFKNLFVFWMVKNLGNRYLWLFVLIRLFYVVFICC